ncbi:MAG: hypothetical protein WC249_03450 [Patescibacteria group bacterium]|jgi:hypothetical protein
MKNFWFFLLFFSIPVMSQDTSNCFVQFSGKLDSVFVEVASHGSSIAWPKFTPGNHNPDSSLSFRQQKNVSLGPSWGAALPKMQRGFSSGKMNDGHGSVIYNISSGPNPADLSAPLKVSVNIPRGKDLFFHGRIFGGPKKIDSNLKVVTEKFSDYFIAREFPIILLDQGKYLIRCSKLNNLDSLKVIYSWTDKPSQAKLLDAFVAVDSAVKHIGQLAPNYWHKYVANFDGVEFTYLYIIGDIVTGLESCGSPYSITGPQFISEEAVYHTLLHTFVGKFCMPKEYMADDGHYHPSDALWFYEGLTTFMGLRFSSGNLDDFANKLAGNLYRAKLANNITDLGDLAHDQKWESWYAKGYLSWLPLQEIGLDAEALVSWLFEKKLIDIGRSYIQSADIMDWIHEFNPVAGELASKNYQGAYLPEAWRILAEAGWSLAPLKESPRWYKYYLGPYSIKPGIQLPTDDYPILSGYPEYLITADSKLVVEAEDNDEALKLFKSRPDELFQIEFSSGEKLMLKDNFTFTDGTPYFMFGKIKSDLSQKQKYFWHKLNYYYLIK